MKRREMLRASFGKAARVLPLALSVTGSLGSMLQAGAGLLQHQEVAAFPRGKAKAAGSEKELTREEE